MERFNKEPNKREQPFFSIKRVSRPFTRLSSDIGPSDGAEPSRTGPDDGSPPQMASLNLAIPAERHVSESQQRWRRMTNRHAIPRDQRVRPVAITIEQHYGWFRRQYHLGGLTSTLIHRINRLVNDTHTWQNQALSDPSSAHDGQARDSALTQLERIASQFGELKQEQQKINNQRTEIENTTNQLNSLHLQDHAQWFRNQRGRELITQEDFDRFNTVYRNATTIPEGETSSQRFTRLRDGANQLQGLRQELRYRQLNQQIRHHFKRVLDHQRGRGLITSDSYNAISDLVARTNTHADAFRDQSSTRDTREQALTHLEDISDLLLVQRQKQLRQQVQDSGQWFLDQRRCELITGDSMREIRSLIKQADDNQAILNDPSSTRYARNKALTRFENVANQLLKMNIEAEKLELQEAQSRLEKVYAASQQIWEQVYLSSNLHEQSSTLHEQSPNRPSHDWDPILKAIGKIQHGPTKEEANQFAYNRQVIRNILEGKAPEKVQIERINNLAGEQESRNTNLYQKVEDLKQELKEKLQEYLLNESALGEPIGPVDSKKSSSKNLEKFSIEGNITINKLWEMFQDIYKLNRIKHEVNCISNLLHQYKRIHNLDIPNLQEWNRNFNNTIRVNFRNSREHIRSFVTHCKSKLDHFNHLDNNKFSNLEELLRDCQLRVVEPIEERRRNR